MQEDKNKTILKPDPDKNGSGFLRPGNPTKKIFLSVPYSDKERIGRLMRFYRVNEKAAELMKDGNIIFSPISLAIQLQLNATCHYTLNSGRK